MILKSEVTKLEYEVKTYTKEDGQRGICHESLLEILENQMPSDVSYNVEVLSATETYCAAECTITDDSCRKIQRFSDVNTNMLGEREPEQEAFAKMHPLLTAVNSAIDAAVRSYLKWPRMYPPEEADAEITETMDVVPEDIDITGTESSYEPEDADPDNTENNTEESDIAQSNEEAKAENNVDGTNESVKETETAPTMEAPVEATAEESIDEPVEKSENNSDDFARLEELGKKTAPASSKYSTMTLDEIWKKNPNWFNYIKNNNRSNTYAEAREYAILREKIEQP